MNGVQWLDDYQDAVVARLLEIPWVVTAGLYPDIPAGFASPAVFFNVASWERAERALGGNVTLNLTCEIYILRSFMAGETDEEEGDPEVLVRNAALKMSDWIHGRQFGPCMAPAVMVSAEPVQWADNDKSTYASWAITFNQLLAVGTDPFEVAGNPTAKEFWFGIFPDIGPNHKDDYELVASAKEGD